MKRRLVIFLVALVVVFDGYDTFVPAYVIKYVMKPWGLEHAQAGLLVSSGLIGFMVGSLAHGPIADRVGRRATLLGGMWISGIFSVATALFANDYSTFLLLRLLTGLGLGTLLPLATTYVTEFAPEKNRNAYVVWGAAVGWATGAVVAALVGIFLTPSFGWHALFWFASLGLIVALAAQFALPESPHFLAARGRSSTQAGSAAALFAPRYRRNTLIIWTCAFLILFDIYGLSGWLPTIMATRGEGFATSFGYGALLQVMSLAGAFACGAIADRRGGRKVPLAIWWLFGGLSVLLLATVNSHLTNFVLIAAAGFFVIGGQFILNNFTALAYDTELRATGVGMELGVGRLGAILGPYIGGLLQQTFHSATTFFWAMAGASLLSAVAINFSNPVTGDVSQASTMPQDALA